MKARGELMATAIGVDEERDVRRMVEGGPRRIRRRVGRERVVVWVGVVDIFFLFLFRLCV